MAVKLSPLNGEALPLPPVDTSDPAHDKLVDAWHRRLSSSELYESLIDSRVALLKRMVLPKIEDTPPLEIDQNNLTLGRYAMEMADVVHSQADYDDETVLYAGRLVVPMQIQFRKETARRVMAMTRMTRNLIHGKLPLHRRFFGHKHRAFGGSVGIQWMNDIYQEKLRTTSDEQTIARFRIRDPKRYKSAASVELATTRRFFRPEFSLASLQYIDDALGGSTSFEPSDGIKTMAAVFRAALADRQLPIERTYAERAVEHVPQRYIDLYLQRMQTNPNEAAGLFT